MRAPALGCCRIAASWSLRGAGAAQQRVVEGHLADVVDEPGGVDQLLVAGAEPGRLGRGPGVAGDGGRVAGRHRVPQGERVERGGEQPAMHLPQLSRRARDLVAALLGLEHVAQQQLERVEPAREQADRRRAELQLGVRGARGEQAGRASATAPAAARCGAASLADGASRAGRGAPARPRARSWRGSGPSEPAPDGECVGPGLAPSPASRSARNTTPPSSGKIV